MVQTAWWLTWAGQKLIVIAWCSGISSIDFRKIRSKAGSLVPKQTWQEIIFFTEILPALFQYLFFKTFRRFSWMEIFGHHHTKLLDIFYDLLIDFNRLFYFECDIKTNFYVNSYTCEQKYIVALVTLFSKSRNKFQESESTQEIKSSFSEVFSRH